MTDIITNFIGRFENFLCHFEEGQRDQCSNAKWIQNLHSVIEGIINMGRQTISAFSQIQDDLEEVKTLRHLVENIWKKLSDTKLEEQEEKTDHKHTKCGSYGGHMNAETVKLLVEQATSPLIKEAKCDPHQQMPCASCRRYEDKVSDLEKQLSEMYKHYNTLSCGIRLVKDEVLRINHQLFNRRFRAAERHFSSEELYNRTCNLKEHLVMLTAKKKELPFRGFEKHQ
ncbi:uncharacterized protein LOC122810910 [Protopterus annectens]|uniref:uncharacterized protein LOC122810910 n=1 Tax=Protopterus annectens TaxID=7888 RepID=UPI001CF9536A|nr:uncharacterized protein LOC122810910 [Protopterus annectens]